MLNPRADRRIEPRIRSGLELIVGVAVSTQTFCLKSDVRSRPGKLSQTPIVTKAGGKHVELLNVAFSMIGYVEEFRALIQTPAATVRLYPARMRVRFEGQEQHAEG